MRHLVVLLLITITQRSFSQVSFIGFDHSTCIQPMNDSFTYSNYTSGGGGSGTAYGYNIYRNGIWIFGDGGTMADGKTCRELVFINDSIGFLVYYSGNTSNRVLRTSDRGQTWADIGGGAPDYFGLYVATPHVAYIVTYWNSPQQLYVGRCSDVTSRVDLSFIYDPSINMDVHASDTLIENELCNQDSILIRVSNGSDTIGYHIRFNIILAGISEVAANDHHVYLLYPNPTQNHFSLSGNLSEVESVELVNLPGELVRVFDPESISENRFSLQELDAAIYFVRLTTRRGNEYIVRLSKK
ncbi:MAG: T9SS type A sorting domain-containing protein [Bacteroidota bacterium]